MCMNEDWLPPLVLLEDSNGDWNRYVELLYQFFRQDFIDAKPKWPNKRVGLKRIPIDQGKEATFWHFISEGESEPDRTPATHRCQRSRWPRPTMEAVPGRKPTGNDRIVWWQNYRKGEPRYLLALPDFSYLVVVADRGDYVLPWTQFPVERQHTRAKLQNDFNAFWASKNS